MKKTVIYSVIASLSILAHELLPQQDSPLFVVAVMWFAWFSMIFHVFLDQYGYVATPPYVKEGLAANIKSYLREPQIYIPATYMMLQHIAMRVDNTAEMATAVAFVLAYGFMCYYLKLSRSL